MLGFSVYISRIPPGKTLEDAVYTNLTPEGVRLSTQVPEQKKLWDDAILAAWSTGFDGISWLGQLADEKKATLHDGNGYPTMYSAQAKVLLPTISAGPPPYKGPPIVGEDYVLQRGWRGRGEIHPDRIAQCDPEEVLFVCAWDQS